MEGSRDSSTHQIIYRPRLSTRYDLWFKQLVSVLGGIEGVQEFLHDLDFPPMPLWLLLEAVQRARVGYACPSDIPLRLPHLPQSGQGGSRLGMPRATGCLGEREGLLQDGLSLDQTRAPEPVISCPPQRLRRTVVILPRPRCSHGGGVP